STWSYAASVPGSTADGDAYISGGSMYVVLGSGKGVSAPVTSLFGAYSPGGLGIVDSLTLVNPLTIANANLFFDLNASTTVGNRVNDYPDVAALADLREMRVLREKTVTGMNGVYVGDFGRADDPVNP